MDVQQGDAQLLKQQLRQQFLDEKWYLIKPHSHRLNINIEELLNEPYD